MLIKKRIVALVSLFAMSSFAAQSQDALVDEGESMDFMKAYPPIAASVLSNDVFPLEKQEKAYNNLKNDLEKDIAECTSSLDFPVCIDKMEKYWASLTLLAQISADKGVSSKMSLLKDRALEFRAFLVALKKHQPANKESLLSS